MRGRNTLSARRVEQGTGTLTVSGGPALKQAIHIARAKAGITSDMQLAQRAHVSYDTLMNWYGEKTVPRGHELEKIAKAAGTSLWALQAAYEGREAEPIPLQDAIRELVDELGRLVEELRLSRAAQVAATSVVFEALGAAGRGPDRTETPHDSEREARAGTGR